MSPDLSPDRTTAEAVAPGTRVRSGRRAPAQRSAVSNGARLFALGGDGRGAWARRWADLVDAHISDMGGPSGLSEAQVALARRAATLAITVEQIEARLSEGDMSVDLDQLGRLIGHQRRVLETIGLRRAVKDVTPNPLAEHFSRPPIREG